MSRSGDTDPTNPIDAQTIANYRQAIEDAAQELPTANARALRSGTERVLSALARYDAERAAMREIVEALAYWGVGGLMPSEYVAKARAIVGVPTTAPKER